MILTDSNGQPYRAHFRHVRLHDRKINARMSGRFDSGSDRWWMRTECTLHAGAWHIKSRPEGDTTPVFEGVAKCSRLDNFDRHKGLKLAFERALHAMFPEDTSMRAQLWASFWTRVRKPRHG